MVYRPIDDSRFSGSGGANIVDGAMTVTSTSSTAWALDGVPFDVTINPLWTYSMGANIRGITSNSNDDIFVVRNSFTNQIYSIDSAGATNWITDWDTVLGSSSTGVGVALLPSLDRVFGIRGPSTRRVVRLVASTGSGVTQVIDNPFGSRDVFRVVPTYDQTEILVSYISRTGFPASFGGIIARHSTGGAVVWSNQLYTTDTSALHIATSPGRVYVMGANGEVFCLDDSDGSILWQGNLTGGIANPATTLSNTNQLAVAQDVLAVSAGGPGSTTALRAVRYYDFDGNLLTTIDNTELGLVSSDIIHWIAGDRRGDFYLAYSSTTTSRRKWRRYDKTGNRVSEYVATTWGQTPCIDVSPTGRVYIGGSLNLVAAYEQV